ncbi:MFS transporter [Streptomyces sp. NPDC015220]|uniref:MFS transporter n=1 Tax=Streptomyces sp. NPDC015220 TaxID=3364947 RepID=UPI0036F7ADAD
MTETRTAPSPRPPRRGLILTAMCLGMFLMQLDATIVNVALPAIGDHLHASVSGLQWVVDAYILPLAALLLIAGRVGDIGGHKRVFITGTAIFALASVGCALAPSGGWLIAARAVQGVGAALELPATLAILAHAFPVPAERVRAIGVWASAAGLSLVAGPVLGGALVDAVGWQSIFWLNVPCAVVTGLLALVVVPATRGSRASLDLPGQLLGTVALGLVAYVAIDGRRQGWTSAPIVAALLVAVVALAGFAVVESRARDALLPPRFFRLPAFTTGNVAGLLMGFALFGLLFVFSLYFQQVGGDSAVEAGARFLPLSVAYMATGPYAGRIVGRLGARWALTAGLALVGGGCAVLTGTAADGYLLTGLPFVAVGAGYALASTSMAATVMGAVPPERAGMASSVNNTARQTGGVLGVAVLGSLLADRAAARGSAGLESGLHDALWIIAACALAGAVLAGATLSGPAPAPGRGGARERTADGPSEVAHR